MTKKRILVVDDETSITRLLKMNLEKNGYVVREENSATKVVETTREFKPDLVLLDVMMPEMDGGDVAAALQADPMTRATKIVFLTAAVKKEELSAHGGMIGGFPYIAKPLDVKGVIAVLEQQLGPS